MRSRLRRDWTDANAKCEAEGCCRVTGDPNFERAHIIGRARDERITKTKAIVNPDSVVPLTRRIHAAYDLHNFDLLPYLTVDEQAQAVKDAGGIMTALIRMTSSRDITNLDKAA